MFVVNVAVQMTEKEGNMSKRSTIYESKKKRTAAAVVCVILVAAMVLALLMAAFV